MKKKFVSFYLVFLTISTILPMFLINSEMSSGGNDQLMYSKEPKSSNDPQSLILDNVKTTSIYDQQGQVASATLETTRGIESNIGDGSLLTNINTGKNVAPVQREISYGKSGAVSSYRAWWSRELNQIGYLYNSPVEFPLYAGKGLWGAHTLWPTWDSNPTFYMSSSIGSASATQINYDYASKKIIPHLPHGNTFWQDQSMQLLPDMNGMINDYRYTGLNNPRGIPKDDTERETLFAQLGASLTNGGKIISDKPDFLGGKYIRIERRGEWLLNYPVRAGDSPGYSVELPREDWKSGGATGARESANWYSYDNRYTSIIESGRWDMGAPSDSNYMYGRIDYSIPISGISVGAEDLDRIIQTLSFTSGISAIGYTYTYDSWLYRDANGDLKYDAGYVYRSVRLNHDFRILIDMGLGPTLVSSWQSTANSDWSGNYFQYLTSEQKTTLASRIYNLARDNSNLKIVIEVKSTKTAENVISFAIKTDGNNYLNFKWYGYNPIKANIFVNMSPIMQAIQNFQPNEITSISLKMVASSISNGLNKPIRLSKVKYETNYLNYFTPDDISLNSLTKIYTFKIIESATPNPNEALTYYKNGFYVNLQDITQPDFIEKTDTPTQREQFLSGFKIYELYWEYSIRKETETELKIIIPQISESTDYIQWEININSPTFNNKAPSSALTTITNSYLEITEAAGTSVSYSGNGNSLTLSHLNLANPNVKGRTINPLYNQIKHYVMEEGVKIINPTHIRDYYDAAPTMEFYIESIGASQYSLNGEEGAGSMRIYDLSDDSTINFNSYRTLDRGLVSYDANNPPEFELLPQFRNIDLLGNDLGDVISIEIKNYELKGDKAIITVSEYAQNGLIGVRYFNTARYSGFVSNIRTMLPHVVTEDNFLINFEYLTSRLLKDTKFLVTAISPLVDINGVQPKYTHIENFALNSTLSLKKVEFNSLSIFGSQSSGNPSIKVELTIENTGSLDVELLPQMFAIPQLQTKESMYVGSNADAEGNHESFIIAPSETKILTSFLIFNRNCPMPLRNSYFYLDIEFSAYHGTIEVEDELIDIFEDLETYTFTDKYLFYSTQRGSILEQFEYDIEITESRIAFEKAYSRITFSDETQFILNIANEEYLVPPREEKAIYTPPSLVMVEVGDLIYPTESMTSIAGPITIQNKIYNSGGKDFVTMDLKYKVQPEMIGSILDIEDGYYSKELVVSGQQSDYYFRYTQSEFDSHVANNWLQVLPTSQEYYLHTTAKRYISSYLGVDYYLYDAKEFRFNYNPQITIRPVYAETIADFPITWKNDPLLSLKTIGYYNILTDEVEANSETIGIMNVHLSPLFTPLRYKLDMGAENDDIKNWKLVQRYFNPSTAYLLPEVPKTQNNIIYPELELNGVSEWAFETYYQFNTIMFNVPTPKMQLISFNTYESNRVETFEAEIEVSNLRRDFTNVYGQVPIQVFDSDYDLSLEIFFDGFYYDVNDTNLDFAGRFQVEFGELLTTQTLLMNIDSIGEGETYTFKVIGERIYIPPTDYSPLIFGLATAVFAGLIWVVFTFRSSEYSAMNDTIYRKLGTRKYILATIGVVSAAFGAMYIFIRYF